jgi:hypothetical protein
MSLEPNKLIGAGQRQKEQLLRRRFVIHKLSPVAGARPSVIAWL